MYTKKKKKKDLHTYNTNWILSYEVKSILIIDNNFFNFVVDRIYFLHPFCRQLPTQIKTHPGSRSSTKNRNQGENETRWFSRVECVWPGSDTTRKLQCQIRRGKPTASLVLLPYLRRGGKGFLAFYAPPGKTLTGVFLDLTGASLADVSCVAQHPTSKCIQPRSNPQSCIYLSGYSAERASVDGCVHIEASR